MDNTIKVTAGRLKGMFGRILCKGLFGGYECAIISDCDHRLVHIVLVEGEFVRSPILKN